MDSLTDTPSKARIDRARTFGRRTYLLCVNPACDRIAGHLFDCNPQGSRHSSEPAAPSDNSMASAPPARPTLPGHTRENRGGNPGAAPHGGAVPHPGVEV